MSVQHTYSNAALAMHISLIRGYAEQLERAQRGPGADQEMIAGLTDCLLSEASCLAEKLHDLGLDGAACDDVAH